jgi:putative hemolysin
MNAWKALMLSGTLLTGACRAMPPEPPAAAARMPNPAVAKCAADGWRTEPVLTNGVPTGSVCVEPGTGRRCEAWAYFRGECPPPEPAAPPPGRAGGGTAE